MDQRGPDQDALDELTNLADELLSQASEVRRQWAELSETLGVEPPEPAPVAERRPPAPQPGEEAERPEADPVRLVALDMMLSGRSREEVREYLRATFGDDDREQVLDEIFAQYGG